MQFLDPGQTVYWRVRGIDLDGVTAGPWSPVRSVSLALTTTPTGLTPASGTSMRDTVVGWAPVPGAADYQVQFANGTSPDWASPSVQTFTTSTTVFEFEDPAAFGVKTYSWRVRLRDWELHPGPWSAVRTFTRTLSPAPSLSAPANGAVVGAVAKLSWTPVVRASHYRVEVAADAAFSVRVSTHITSETAFDITTGEQVIPYVLQKGHTYYWRVMGIDRSDLLIADDRPASTWSSTRTFVYDPPVSQLLTPTNGATVSVPSLTWSPQGASFHRVVIEDVAGTIVDEARTWASSYTPQVRLDPADGPFTWYVERVALDNSSPPFAAWRSEERTFGLTPIVPSSTIQILVPTDLHTIDNPRIRWTALEGAAYYHIVVPLFPNQTEPTKWTSAPVIYPDHTFPAYAMDPSTKNYQVWAYDDDDQPIAMSDTATWTIDSLPAPTIVGPPDCPGSGCDTFAEPPRLSWSAVAGATVYHAHVPHHLGSEPTPETSTLDILPGVDVNNSSAIGHITWTVDACVAGRCSPTATARFRKETAIPAALSPVDSATVVGPQVTLDWDALLDSPVAPGVIGSNLTEASSYQVEIHGDGVIGGPDDSTDSTQATYLFAPGTHSWGIRGQVKDATGTDVRLRSMTVTWPGPQLSAPSAGADVSRVPAFSWQAMPFTKGYQFQLFADTTATGSPLVNTSTMWPSYVPHAEVPNGTYAWRVRAASGSSWSALRTLTIGGSSGPVDDTPPTGSIEIAGGDALSASTSVTLSTAATDDTTGVAEVRLSNDGMSWTTRPYAPTQAWTLLPTNGTRTVYVQWKDGAGNWSAVATDTIVLDTVAPVASAPGRRLVAGTAISSGRTTVRLTWTGSDAGSGIARYELRQSTDGRPFASVSTTLTSTSLDRLLAPAHTYRFQVRAIDGAGNAGAWMTGSTFRLSHYGETSTRIHYTGSWGTTRSTAYWGGQARASSSAGARATISVTGRMVEWVARRGPGRGKAQVYVNGVLRATVDLYAPTYQNQRVVWAASWAASATRTISIRVLGTSGRPRVELDAIVSGG